VILGIVVGLLELTALGLIIWCLQLRKTRVSRPEPSAGAAEILQALKIRPRRDSGLSFQDIGLQPGQTTIATKGGML
jgi:hypothetical protein